MMNGNVKRGGTAGRFHLLLLAFQILWMRQALVQAQNSQCTSEEVNAYMQCVADNPCRCSNCDPNPLDSTPEINVDTPPQDCRDVNRIFCPLIRCCSTCEEVARAWYECTFQAFALQTIGVECSTTCDGYSTGDVNGGCDPSSSPAPSPAPYDLPISMPANSSNKPSAPFAQRQSDFPSNPPSYSGKPDGGMSALPTSSGCQANRRNVLFPFSLLVYFTLMSTCTPHIP